MFGRTVMARKGLCCLVFWGVMKQRVVVCGSNMLLCWWTGSFVSYHDLSFVLECWHITLYCLMVRKKHDEFWRTKNYPYFA